MTEGESPVSPGRMVFDATLDRIAEHGAQTRSLFLRVPGARSLAFTPGQFISLQLPVAGEMLIRPYSIASDPEAGAVLEICLNLVPGGVGSRYLFGLEVGSRVRFTGPWGTFTLAEAPAAECVFIADATGIAPIRPMLRRALASAGFPVRLHYRAASAQALLFRAEFEAAARQYRRFTFEPVIADASAVLLDLARERYVDADRDRSRHFYLCGVGEIVWQLRDLLRGAGYVRRAVHYEKW